MLERIGSDDILVQDYTSNFKIKEYIQEELIPKAFPSVPVNKLNVGFIGVISELISTAIEDSSATAALMMNESFITRAVLPKSIYSEASLFDLGYSFAIPSKCNFVLEMSLDDVINNSQPVIGEGMYRYILDRDTQIILGSNTYRLDYDIVIDWQMIDGKRVFNIYYDMSSPCAISTLTSQYIKHQVASSGWLVLFINPMEFERKVETNSITDNLITTNSDITLKWTRQIAGIDLTYISPRGQRMPMKVKPLYSRAVSEPFVWYTFNDDNTLSLSFNSNAAYWSPEFNSKIESVIYTCTGAAANFDTYNSDTGVPVQKVSTNYSYNADTRMVALCYSGSTGGANKGTIEDLRNDVILAYNSANCISTDNDLRIWFENYAKRYDTKAMFFKRRDDPGGRLFSQFVAIVKDSYVYPTNTLTLSVNESDFDYVNRDANGIAQEFIIKPGHLWEYDDTDTTISRDTVRMVEVADGNAMIMDDSIPSISDTRPFMFVNPFYIKIYREPAVSMNYNYLLDHTSWPEDIPFDSNSFYQFQLATFHIERTLSQKNNNMYHIDVICIPVVTTNNGLKYIEGVGSEFPVYNNNMRMVLITRTATDGETGYIELTPTEERDGGSYVFSCDIAVHDNIGSDMKLEVDLENTPGMKSLLTTGPNAGKVLMDSAETNFHFAVLMKDSSAATSMLFENPTYQGYVMANRFTNDYHSLTLYKPMSMMRSTITFSGENGSYNVKATLSPLLKYDVPLDEEGMAYFIRAFSEQYAAMEPIISILDGNSYLDFKLYNTYGRSSNYYIGPEDGKENLYDSTILLDNVYVKIKLRMSVYDRSMYSQTVQDVVNDISLFFEAIDSGSDSDVHVSDLIHAIIDNNPNVRYVRFLGFNDYDANKQSIFVKFSDISELRQDQLMPYVPEMIRVDANSIDITEET